MASHQTICNRGEDRRAKVTPMGWIKEGLALERGRPGDPDSLHAAHPCVLEEDDGTLRMWYSGHDGNTWRILGAVGAESGWQRLGIAIDAGLAGESDDYGVEAPSVIKTPAGYLMAYGGFDGEVTRLHMASSGDGQRWVAQGTIMQRGQEDSVAATHPCLVVTGERWWMFFSGTDGSENGRRAAILAAISQTGASWDRLGPVLEPASDELAVRAPCVIDTSKGFCIFFATDYGQRVDISTATSSDGLRWDRRGAVLEARAEGLEGLTVDAPCVVRLKDGSLRMWYSTRARTEGDDFAYRICSARFSGHWMA